MHNYRYFQTIRKRAKEKSRLGVLTRERNRIARAEEAIEIGRIDFYGKMFGGSHVIRCLNRDSEEILLLEIDGQPFSPKTYRGVLRLIAAHLSRQSLKAAPKLTSHDPCPAMPVSVFDSQA